ncbi:MAG: transglutaminase-like domain-containing protein [Betaproteobacteria bacterium]|nr:transglutaminase-like domain-containing protein [Betaproteobacteria bacterium]
MNIEIYNWVRNNIEWQPTGDALNKSPRRVHLRHRAVCGVATLAHRPAMRCAPRLASHPDPQRPLTARSVHRIPRGQQTADMTLDVKRGNAMDIATLTIALLRAANIPARYAYGTVDIPAAQFINMAGDFANIDAAWDFASAGGIPITGITSGGVVNKIRMQHVWVEAAVPYYPSRGAKPASRHMADISSIKPARVDNSYTLRHNTCIYCVFSNRRYPCVKPPSIYERYLNSVI